MMTLAAASLLLAIAVTVGARQLCENGNGCHESTTFRQLLRKAPRIVGGDDAEEGRFPYMVSLMTSDRLHQCGGVLIDKRWVLTAAHCFDSLSPLSKTPFLLIGAVNTKSSKKNDGVEEMLASEVIIHEKYKRYDSGFDIALVKLPKKTKAKVFANLPDADSELKESQLVLALGWGRIGRQAVPTTLQQVDLEVLSNKHCQSNWDKVDGNTTATTILDSMLCTFSREGDTCSGDSGGPLLEVNTLRGAIGKGNPEADILHGLVSFGSKDCTEFKRAGVNTRVVFFKNWILTTIGKPPQAVNEKVGPIVPLVRPSPADCPNYTVKAGDTCFDLWVANGMTEAEFREANPQLNKACALQIGDELCLPATEVKTCSEPYIVEVGDTCFDLWVANGLSEKAFRKLNPRLPPSCGLFPGQTICLG